MAQQIPVSDEALGGNEQAGRVEELVSDVASRRAVLANVIFVGHPGSRDWVLVDAGVRGSAGLTRSAAEERFGPDNPPAAIVLTHGHFDHVGALEKLLREWDAPLYAHHDEFPYLSGALSYPEPNTSAGGGMMTLLSEFFPRGPIDVSRWLLPLPADHTVPGMTGWEWIHTPGHTPGHISLWRPGDQTLIAGDAFITTAQESAYAALTERPELHGPPRYFTPDWDAAETSVKRLADLLPVRCITGHGSAMEGPEFQRALRELAERFREVAPGDLAH